MTQEKITLIFGLMNCTIKRIDDAKDPHNGMIYTSNKEKSIHYYHTFEAAYNYFTKMNWIPAIKK